MSFTNFMNRPGGAFGRNMIEPAKPRIPERSVGGFMSAAPAKQPSFWESLRNKLGSLRENKPFQAGVAGAQGFNKGALSNLGMDGMGIPPGITQSPSFASPQIGLGQQQSSNPIQLGARRNASNFRRLGSTGARPNPFERMAQVNLNESGMY